MTRAHADAPADDEHVGGDPACWAAFVCAECGAVNGPAPNDEAAPTACWRCGAALDEERA